MAGKTKMAQVVITREITLPRFTFQVGEKWEVRIERISKEGFTVGGGFLPSDYYKAA